MELIGMAAAALLAVPVALISLAHPARTILPLYAAVIPLGNVIRLPVPLPSPFNTLSSLLGAAATVACLGHIILYRRGRIPTLPVALWVTFLAWATVTTFWALDKGAALDLALIAVPLVVLMVVTGILPTDDVDLDVVRTAIMLGGVAVGGYAFYLLSSGSVLPIHGETERFSIASDPEQTNPNQVAASLLLPMTLSIDRIIEGGHRWLKPMGWKLLGSVGLLLTLIAIVASGSRGGVLAAVIGFVAVLISWWRRRPESRLRVWRVVVTSICFAFLLSLSVIAALNFFPNGRFAQTIKNESIQRLVHTETGSSGRSEIWTTGRLACRSYCGWGAGFDNFPVVYNNIFPFSGAAKNVGLDRPAHNLYLELAVETGLIGVTLFSLALLLEWKGLKSEQMTRLAPSLGAALIALLVANIFEGQIWFKYFWIVFILIRIVEGVEDRDERTSPSTSGRIGSIAYS